MHPGRWVAVGVLVAVLVTGLVVWRAGDDDTAAPATTTTTSSSSTSTTIVGEVGAPGLGDPYFPTLGNGGYDVDHYDLELSWLADGGRIDGVTTVVANATQDLSRFDLDLSGLEVRAVVVDDRPATFVRQDRELQITPARPIATGDEFTAKVTYGGVPEPIREGTDLFALGWQRDGREAFVASEPSGAETWFPSNDHPADKATYTIHVTAPADQVVTANGEMKAKDDIGHGTLAWTYEESDPMATYLVQVAIGDYVLVDDGTVGSVRVRHAFHRTLADDARATTDNTKAQLALLASLFGPFPFDQYGVLAVPEDLGFALETQTLTLIGSDIAAQREGAASILVHEMAHQWFGNAVSPTTWKDIWLNEGFATYAEWLAEERTGGASAHDRAREWLARTDLDFTTPPGDPGADELFSPTVYYRGAMTLQALRETVGDDHFFTILRRWHGERTGGNGSTPELLALAEAVSGQQLDALFQTWLYDRERPSF